MREIRRTVYLAIGWVSLALGLIGLALPVMPTVPFVLVAFWAFAQSSPRLSRRLLANPHFGPSLRNWLRYNAIPRRVKYITTVMMAGGCVAAWLLGAPVWVLTTQITICMAVAAYVLTRPEPPATEGSKTCFT